MAGSIVAENALKNAQERNMQRVEELDAMARHNEAQIDRLQAQIVKLTAKVNELEAGNFKEVRIDMEALGSWS